MSNKKKLYRKYTVKYLPRRRVRRVRVLLFIIRIVYRSVHVERKKVCSIPPRPHPSTGSETRFPLDGGRKTESKIEYLKIEI